MALKTLKKALKIKSNQDKVDQEKLKCLLLKSDILKYNKKLEKALICLNRAEEIFPTTKLLVKKAKLLEILEKKEAGKYYLQAFIANGKLLKYLEKASRIYIKRKQEKKVFDLFENFLIKSRQKEFIALFGYSKLSKWKTFVQRSCRQ